MGERFSRVAASKLFAKKAMVKKDVPNAIAKSSER